MAWDEYAVGAEGFEIVGAEEFSAVAGAADLMAQYYGYSSGEELMAAMGEMLEGGVAGYDAYAGYDDAWAGASVEELLAAAAGAAPRRAMPLARRGAPPMMRPAMSPAMLRRPGMPLARPTMPMMRPAAPVPSRPMMRPPVSRALPAQPQRTTTATTREGARMRIYPLNFDSVVEIPPGAIFPVTQRPQVPFRPQRLIVPSTIAPDFLIVNLNVGKNPQQAAVSPGSAVIYTESSTAGNIHTDGALVGHEIVIQVQNISSAPRRFLATIVGEAQD